MLDAPNQSWKLPKHTVSIKVTGCQHFPNEQIQREDSILCGKCNLQELIATETVDPRNSHLEFRSSKHSGVFQAILNLQIHANRSVWNNCPT